jgi:hypothetical protein
MEKDLEHRIEYPINKDKVLWWLVGSIFLMVIGILCIEYFKDKYGNPEILIRLFYILLIIYFGFIIIIIKKLLDKKPGLIIDNTGIFVNVNFIPSGFVLWEDIVEIKINKVDINSMHGKIKDNFYKIIINNPEKYISRQKNPVFKIVCRLNYLFHGTPILMTESLLKCNSYEIEYNLFEQMNEWKKKK